MKNLKKRALSWLLALALVLGMVPAGLLPQAEALGLTSITITKLDSGDGSWEVQVANPGETGSTNESGVWVLALVPNLTTVQYNTEHSVDSVPQKNTAFASEQESIETVYGMKKALGTTDEGLGLPDGSYMVVGNSSANLKFLTGDTTTLPENDNNRPNNNITEKLPTLDNIIKALAGHNNGQYFGVGGQEITIKEGETTSIPFVAILITKQEPMRTIVSNEFTFEYTVEVEEKAELKADPINIVVTVEKDENDEPTGATATGLSTTIKCKGNTTALIDTSKVKPGGFLPDVSGNNMNEVVKGDVTGGETATDGITVKPALGEDGAVDATLTFAFVGEDTFNWSTYIVGGYKGNSTGYFTVPYYVGSDTSNPIDLIVPVTITVKDISSITAHDLTFNGEITAPEAGQSATVSYTSTVPGVVTLTISGEDGCTVYTSGDSGTQFGGGADTAWSVVWKVGGTQKFPSADGTPVESFELSADDTVTLEFTPPASVAAAGTYEETYTFAYADGGIGFDNYVTVDLTAIIDEKVPDTTTYTVKYDPNGGKGSAYTDPASYASNASVKVKSPADASITPYNSGYVFAGWSTVANPSSRDTIYAAGDEFTIEADTTLYAQWKTAVSVTLQKNDTAKIGEAVVWLVSDTSGTGPFELKEDTVSGDEGVYLASVDVPDGDYTVCIGGNDMTNNSTGKTVTVSDNDREFTLDYYDITFSSTDNSADMANTGMDTSVAITTGHAYGTPTIAGGTFLEGTVITLKQAPELGYGGDVKWTPGKTNVAGHTLTSPANTGDPYTLTVGAQDTLDASYTANTYKIVYVVGDGATDKPTDIDPATIDTDLIPSTNPSKTGFTFDGWTPSYEKSGNGGTVTGTKIASDDTSITLSDLFETTDFPPSGTTITLTAIWTQDTGGVEITVTKNTGAFTGLEVYLSADTSLDKAGGTDFKLTDTGNNGKYTSNSIPVDSYYVFIGDEKTSTSQEITVTDGGEPAKKTYEYFTAKAEDGDGSTGAAINSTLVSGHKVTVSSEDAYLKGSVVTLSATAKTGYHGSAKWTLTDSSASAMGTGASANQLTINDQVTATASFDANVVTVVLKKDGVAFEKQNVYLSEDNSLDTSADKKLTEGNDGTYTYTAAPNNTTGYYIIIDDLNSSTDYVYATPVVVNSNSPEAVTLEFFTVNFAGVKVENEGFNPTSVMIDPTTDSDKDDDTIPAVTASADYDGDGAGTAIDITTGHIVPKGAKVTFNLSSDALTTSWGDKDYELDWSNEKDTVGSNTALTGAYQNIGYDENYAGYTLTYSEGYGTITATLKLNLHTVTAHFKANTLSTVKLTDTAGTPNVRTQSVGENVTSVAFEVPKGNDYDIVATPKTDVSVLGYKFGTNDPDSKTVNTTPDATADLDVDGEETFAVATAQATYEILLSDSGVKPDDDSDDVKATGNNVDLSSTWTDASGYVFGKYTTVTKTVTIKNTGNSPLYNVTVEDADDNSDNVNDGFELLDTAGTSSTRSLKVADVLAVGESVTVTFKVQFPKDKDAGTYTDTFAITATKDGEGNVVAPINPASDTSDEDNTVHYNPSIKVTAYPLPTKEETPNSLTIENDTKNQTTGAIDPGDKLDFNNMVLLGKTYGTISGVSDLSDIEYQWYWATSATAAPEKWNAIGNRATVPSTGITYDVATNGDDAGKYFKLVFTGTTNYKETLESNVLGPVAYAPAVTVKLDGNVITSVGDYTVALRPDGASDDSSNIPLTFTSNGVFTLTDKYLDGDKSYTVRIQAVPDTTDKTGDLVTLVDGNSKDVVISAASQGTTVEYFSVRYVGTVAIRNEKLNGDDLSTTTEMYDPKSPLSSVGATVSVNESTVNIAAITKDDDPGTPVLKGTAVVFALSDTAVTNWGSKDYNLNWTEGDGALNKDDETNSDIDYGTDGAAGKTRTVTYGETQGLIATNLKLNLYTVTVHFEEGRINAAELKDGASTPNVFEVTGIAGNATSAQITGVPIGSYTVGATAANTDISILGYNVTTDQTDATKGPEVKATSTATLAVDGDGEKIEAFAVVTAKATYAITLTDPGNNGGSDEDDVTGDDNTDVTATWAPVTYGAYSDVSRVITITNTGNTTLKNLKVEGVTGGKFTVSDLSTTTLAPDGTATFKVTFADSQAANEKGYSENITITATKDDGKTVAPLNPSEGTEDNKVLYTPTQVVEKALITTATVADIAQPDTGKKLDTTTSEISYVVQTGTDTDDTIAPPLKGGDGNPAVSWTDSDTSAAAGKEYTVTVTMTPDSNHYFDTKGEGVNYTILTKGDGETGSDGGKATVTVDEETGELVLTYTFPPTAPTLEKVTLEATDWFSADAAPDDKAITADSGGTVSIKMYYALIPTDKAPNTDPTAADIVGGSLTPIDGIAWKFADSADGGKGYTAVFGTDATTDALEPYKDYTVYAVVEVTGENTGKTAVSAVCKATDTTWHKVILKVKDASDDQRTIGNVTATSRGGQEFKDTDGYGPDNEVIIGVDDDMSLGILAALDKDVKNWRFEKWTATAADDATGTLTGGTEADATWKADETAAAADVVTLTASFEAGYGIVYNGNGSDGGSTPTDTKTYFASDSVIAATNTFERTGYTFKEWSTMEDGTDGNANKVAEGGSIDVSVIQADQTGVKPGESLTLYAQWTPVTPTIERGLTGTTVYGSVPDYSPGTLTVSNKDNLASSSYTWKIVDETKAHGFTVDTNGKISGRAQIVGTIEFYVTVTITVDEKPYTSEAVKVTIKAEKATPTVNVVYDDSETYYVGDSLRLDKLETGTKGSTNVFAPYWNPAADEGKGKWETKDLTNYGTLSFATEDSKYKLGNDQSYTVNFAPENASSDFKNGADSVAADKLYNNASDEVLIDAIEKTYKFELVPVDTTNKWSTSGTYLDTDAKTIVFRIKNTGNQTLYFNAGSFAIADTASGNVEFAGTEYYTDDNKTPANIGENVFTVAPHPTDPSTGVLSTEYLVVKVSSPGTLTVGTYTDKLTATAYQDSECKTAVETKDEETLTYTVGRKMIPYAEIRGLVAPAGGSADTSKLAAGGYDSTAGVDSSTGKDKNGNLYYSIDLGWKTGNTALAASDKFQAGKGYTATVTLTAGENYYFANVQNDATTATEGCFTLTDGTTTVDGTRSDYDSKTDNRMTLVMNYAAIEIAAPTVVAGAVNYESGKFKVTDNNGTDSGTSLKYYVSTASSGIDASTVWTSGTDVNSGTPTDIKTIEIKPHTTYYVYAVAGNGNNFSALASDSFTTPYQVTITDDGEGYVEVKDSWDTTTADKVLSLYGKDESTDDNLWTGVTIPESVGDMAVVPSDAAKYTFETWTITPANSGKMTGSSDDVYSYTPGGDTGIIKVSADFIPLYKVAYDGNQATGGSVPKDDNAYREDATVAALGNTGKLERTGYTFDGWALKASGVSSGDKLAANGTGTFTIKDALDIQTSVQPGGTITLYAVWKSNDLTLESQSATAIFNMNDADWTKGDSNTAGTSKRFATLAAANGTGKYTYALVGAPEWLAIGGTGGNEIIVKDKARVGDVKLKDDGTLDSYTFQVKVTDGENGMEATADFTLTVVPAQPKFDETNGFTYVYEGASTGMGYAYDGDPVVWDQVKAFGSTVIRDPYTDVQLNTAANVKGVWTSVAASFDGNDGDPTDPVNKAETNDYVFTYKVTDSDENNYLTISETKNLKAVKRDPSIEVATDTEDVEVKENEDFGVRVTNPIRVIYGNTPKSITVFIKNGGNTTLTSVEVAQTDSYNAGYSHTFTNNTANLEPGYVDSDELTITPPSGKKVSTDTYDAIYYVTGKTEAQVETVARYTVEMTVVRKPIHVASITGLTAPVLGDPTNTPVYTVTDDGKPDETYGDNYNATLEWSVTGGAKLTASDEFEAGKSYTATITLTPNDNHTFKITDMTKEQLDGRDYTVNTQKVDTTSTTADGITYKYEVVDHNLVITVTYPALPSEEVKAEIVATAYNSANITSMSAGLAVDTTYFYVVTTDKNDDLTAKEIKDAALGNSTVAGQVSVTGAYGIVTQAYDATDKNANWDEDADGWTGPITLSGLKTNTTYYLYVAAQPESEYKLNTDNGLAKGEASDTTAKKLTVSVTNAGGDVAGEGITNTNKPTVGNPVVISRWEEDGNDDYTATAKGDGWKVKSSQVTKDEGPAEAATDAAKVTYTYGTATQATHETIIAFTFHKVIYGTPEITSSDSEGDVVEGATLTATGNKAVGIGDTTGLDDFGSSDYAKDLSYQWQYHNGTGWEDIAGATGMTLSLVEDPSGPIKDLDTYAGKKFKVIITYKGDPALDGTNSSVETEIGPLELKLDTPVPDLQISETGNTNSNANDKDTNKGGLYVSFLKIEQDNGTIVKEYLVTLKDSTGKQVGKTVTITANGAGPYTHHWDADLTDVIPGNTYTVEVVAVPKPDLGYTNSDPGEDDLGTTAGKITLTVKELQIAVENKVFNGVNQTGAAVGNTTLQNWGAANFTYEETSAGTSNDDSKLHVDLIETGTDDDNLYYVFVSTTGGTWYLPIAKTKLDTTNSGLASDEWQITQAPTTLALTKSSLGGGVDRPLELDKTALPYVYYVSDSADTVDDAWETGNTVTSYFDLTYAVTSSPNSKAEDYTLTGASFTPSAVGNYVITVTAKYKDGVATDQFKADLAEPKSVEIKVEVTDKVLTKIEVLSPDRVATYATAGEDYYDPTTADSAKKMSMKGVVIRLHWDSGTEDITLDATASNAPPSMAFKYTNPASERGGIDDVKGGGVYFNRADTTLITVEYLGISSVDNGNEDYEGINFTLKTKTLIYETYAEEGKNTKPWDGTTDITANMTAGVRLQKDQIYATYDDYTAGPDDVKLNSDELKVAFADPSVGTHNIVITDGTPKLTGDDAGFYTLTGELGQATIEKAVIKNPTVTVGTPEEGKPFPTDVNVMDETYIDDTEKHSTVTIVWQEKSGDTWVTTGDPTPQPGKTYRPVITLTPDDKHVLDGAIDQEAINGKPNGADGATITGDKNKYVYTGAVTEIPGIPVPPILKFDDVYGSSKLGPDVEVERKVYLTSGTTPSGTIQINLGAYDNTVYDVRITPTTNELGAALTVNGDSFGSLTTGGSSLTYTVDLSKIDTSTANETYMLVLTAQGASVDGAGKDVEATYRLVINVNAPYVPTPTPPAEEEVCPVHVFYWVGLHGVTDMPTAEKVEEGAKPVAVPAVTANAGYEFKGWSLTKPVEGEEAVLVDPATVTITEDTVFYAVYEELEVVPVTGFHEHYVIGYPDGTFGPADDITRGSVATIIARAILPNFVEGSDYGNPGGYLDVEGHWAESAIAYCSIYGVFKGYDDGNFYPDKPITRQEFALVIARLNGVQPNQGVPFTDMDDAAFWAMDGIYTSYANGWFNGYLDNTFKPLNNIARSEAVKVFNAYLKRGVDADGLSDMTEYVHSGTASNNTENGINQYMTWPDVPETYWAYYEIIEAANDHEFHYTGENFDQLPEHWTKCWIDEVWRYHDDPNDGGPAAN